MLACLAMLVQKCATVLHSHWSTFYLGLGKTVAHVLTNGNILPHLKACPRLLCLHNN